MYIYDGRTTFYQWDTNQKVTSESFKVGDEVHFFNLKQPNALVVLAYELNGEIVADVPNILLQSSYPIIVYRMYIDNNGRHTREEYTFKVAQRAKPINYVYTETEIKNYADIDARVDKLEGEGLANAVADYLKENPVQAGATKEEAEQIAKNKADIETLNREKLSADALSEAVNDALTQAKASGEFKGEPGVPGKTPEKGKDYFTDADKQEIAEQAAQLVEIPEGGNVELDTTLTASGKAADAKAVGDALNGKLSKSGGTMAGKIVFPTGDQNVGFANSEDMKIFGYGTVDGTVHMRMGDTQYPFQIRGNGERVKYNDSEIALMGDIPTDDHINGLINTALGVIENGTY